MAKSIGSNVAVVLTADSTGLASGMQRAQQVSKAAATNIQSQWTGVFKGMAMGVGMSLSSMAIGAVVNKVRGMWEHLSGAAERYREEAHEAIEMGEALGVSARSMYLISAAAKNAPFELVAKVIGRYNMAVYDSSKASMFAALGLKRMAAEGENTVDVFRDLIGALQNVAPSRRMVLIKELMGLRPDAMMPIMPLFAQDVGTFNKRIELAQKFGGIPTKADLNMVDMLFDERRIGKTLAVGIERRFGALTTGPIDVIWERLKNSFMMAANQNITQMMIGDQGQWKGPEGGDLFRSGVFPIYYIYKQIKAMRDANEEMNKPEAREMARKQLIGQDVENFLRAPRAKLDALKKGEKFFEELDSAIATMRRSGATAAEIDQFRSAALSLDNQLQQAERLKKLVDENKDPLEELRDQMRDLDALMQKDDTAKAGARGLEALEKKWGVLNNPVNQYRENLEKIDQIEKSRLGGNFGQFWQGKEERAKARADFLETLGVSRDPLQAMRERARLLLFAGEDITPAERARSMAGLFNQLFPQLGRQSPVEALTKGSVGAARAITQWQIDSKREGLSAAEEVKARLDLANRINQLQLEESKRIAAAVEANGIGVVED